MLFGLCCFKTQQPAQVFLIYVLMHEIAYCVTQFLSHVGYYLNIGTYTNAKLIFLKAATGFVFLCYVQNILNILVLWGSYHFYLGL